MAEGMNFKTTADIKVSKSIVDQVIGQEDAVQVVKKAAKQRRHVLLIGEPGTGKSMLGLALAELLPKETLVDTLSFPNPNDENQPLIRTVPAGKGRELAFRSRMQGMKNFKNQYILLIIVALIAFFLSYWTFNHYANPHTVIIGDEAAGTAVYGNPTVGAIMFFASSIGGLVFVLAFVLMINMGKRLNPERIGNPRVIVDNFNKKQVPFLDATGAHAGALLGDILHDPFQSLISSNKIVIIDDKNVIKDTAASKLIDELFITHAKNILKRKQNNYEAIHLPKNELFVLGETNGSVSPVEVLSSNRYDYTGEVIKLTTPENKEIIVTPDHKIAVWRGGKIVYAKAKNIKESDKLVAKSEAIIDEQDIICTYDKRQQEQCRLYYQYAHLKDKHPAWGYKRIARALGQSYSKTRWWHGGKLPYPIQTINWLMERRLLPLKIEDPRLPLIAKIMGATFGDGGIFDNLNGIFLSSAEKEAVQEFGADLEEVFGLGKNENSRIIEGGEYGHSWCYQNTNRNVTRFFLALGAPRGNKTKIELNIPRWVYLNREFKDNFFGSLFGSEIGIPKVHVSKKSLNTFDFGITGTKSLERNRVGFLKEIAKYLDEKSIQSTSISMRITRNPGVIMYRLMISGKAENIINFITLGRLNYCAYKKEKLINTVNEFMDLKREKYHELINRGYGAESVMNLLRISPAVLYIMLNYERISA